MKVIFLTHSENHELDFDENCDLPDLARQVFDSVVGSTEGSACRSDLEAQVYEGVLNALVEEEELYLGEVTGDAA